MARIDDIARAIMEQEGSMDLSTMQPKPGSVNYKMVTTKGLWNVGHINWAGQSGAIPVVLTVGGRQWAGWPTYDASYAGLVRQITIDANRGDTIKTFIEGAPDARGNLTGGYAPSSDGNFTSAYIAHLSNRLGVGPDTRLSDIISGGGQPANPTPAPEVNKSQPGRAKTSGAKPKTPSKAPAPKSGKR